MCELVWKKWRLVQTEIIHDGIKQPVMAKKDFFFDGLNLNTLCPRDKKIYGIRSINIANPFYV